MTDTTHIRITIGNRISLLERVVRVMIFLCAVSAIPILNHLALSGHWLLDTVGAIIGIVALAAAVTDSLSPFSKTFQSRKDAILYVSRVDLKTGEF